TYTSQLQPARARNRTPETAILPRSPTALGPCRRTCLYPELPQDLLRLNPLPKIYRSRVATTDNHSNPFPIARSVPAAEQPRQRRGSARFRDQSQHFPQRRLCLPDVIIANQHDFLHITLRDRK